MPTSKISPRRPTANEISEIIRALIRTAAGRHAAGVINRRRGGVGLRGMQSARHRCGCRCSTFPFGSDVGLAIDLHYHAATLIGAPLAWGLSRLDLPLPPLPLLVCVFYSIDYLSSASVTTGKSSFLILQYSLVLGLSFLYPLLDLRQESSSTHFLCLYHSPARFLLRVGYF